MKTSPDHAAFDIATIRAAFHTIQDDLGAAYVEREAAVEAIVLAALSGQNCLLIGPPGTGKSALFSGFLSHFSDGRTFQWLVTKFSTPDELFGPVKLSALKEDRWDRNLAGRMADCHAAFLDEFFKAGDAILNTLLQAINERTFAGQKIPLRMTVAASNELPTDEGLAAVYDRFVLRDVVDYVSADDTWAALLAVPPIYAPSVRLSLADWQTAVDDVARVALPPAALKALVTIRAKFREAGVILSDRRWIALTRVLRASAWLDGRDKVALDDMRVLAYGAWSSPEQRPIVKAILDAMDSGPAKRATEVIDTALNAYHALPSDPAGRRAARPALITALNKAAGEVAAIVDDGVSTRARERIEARRAELDAAIRRLTEETAKGIGQGLAAFAGAGRRAAG